MARSRLVVDSAALRGAARAAHALASHVDNYALTAAAATAELPATLPGTAIGGAGTRLAAALTAALSGLTTALDSLGAGLTNAAAGFDSADQAAALAAQSLTGPTGVTPATGAASYRDPRRGPG